MAELYRIKIAEKEEAIARLEKMALEKIEQAKKAVEAEFKGKLSESDKKMVLQKEMYERSLKTVEEWKNKVADAKYKYKQTKKGADVLAEAQEKFKMAKEKAEELKLHMNVFKDVSGNFDKEKKNKTDDIIKKIEAQKKQMIKDMQKEIKGFEKEIKRIEKEMAL